MFGSQWSSGGSRAHGRGRRRTVNNDETTARSVAIRFNLQGRRSHRVNEALNEQRPPPTGVRGSSDAAKHPVECERSLTTTGITDCPECGSRVRRSLCKAIGEVAALGSCAPVSVEIFHCDKCDFPQGADGLQCHDRRGAQGACRPCGDRCPTVMEGRRVPEFNA